MNMEKHICNIHGLLTRFAIFFFCPPTQGEQEKGLEEGKEGGRERKRENKPESSDMRRIKMDSWQTKSVFSLILSSVIIS